MIAPALTGPIRIRRRGDGALHCRKYCSDDLLWLLGIVTSSVLGPGSGGPCGVRGMHSDLNHLTVSEGLRPPFYSEREFMAQSDHPLFFSLAEEASKLVFICSFGGSSAHGVSVVCAFQQSRSHFNRLLLY